MTRVVVVGDLMTDAVARAAYPLAKGSDTPASVTMHGGGSGANVAAWLAVEHPNEVEVAFIGRRGSDIAGRNRDMELMGYGVDARLVMDPERPTGTCVVLITHKGDRTMMSDPGANAALLPDDIPADLFSPGSHLHLSGYALLNEGSRKAALHALALAGQANMSVSVDGGSSSPLKRAGAEPFFEWTQGTRLLIVSADEAEVLTGREEPEQAAKVLTAWYPQVVIKLGPEGALWYTNGRPDPIVAGAEAVEKVVDGTGAGDAFAAGFLPAWLEGKPPAEALTAGCRLAAKAIGHLGARPPL
ncbi:carbohydrate kinase family protein [Actinocorallia lasiicapitis]